MVKKGYLTIANDCEAAIVNERTCCVMKCYDRKAIFCYEMFDFGIFAFAVVGVYSPLAEKVKALVAGQPRMVVVARIAKMSCFKVAAHDDGTGRVTVNDTTMMDKAVEKFICVGLADF